MSHDGRLFQQDLWEIEDALSLHPSVHQAAVAFHEEQLLAYVVTHANMALDVAELRASLGQSLPDHKIPTAIVAVEVLPRTANGQVDLAALKPREPAAFAEPEGEVEGDLARIWSETLQIERVGRHDNVFELGGYSLQAINLVRAINAHFGCRFRLGDVFEHPDLLSMAARVSNLLAQEVATDTTPRDASR